MLDSLRNKTYHFLRGSESFFRTDMVYLAKGGFWLGFGQILSALLAFTSSVIFANFIPKEVYGNYKFVIATTSILGAISLTGMGTIVTQSVARGAEGVLGDAIRTTLRWGVVMVICSVILSLYYLLNGNLTLGISILIGGISLLFITSYGLYGNYLIGKKNFKDNTLYNSIGQIVTTIAVVITAIATKNVVAIVAAFFVISAISSMVFYKVTISKNKINDVKDATMMIYSKHVSAMNFFGTLASQANKILLFHYLGAAQLAIFAFSQAIPDQFRGAFKNLFGLVLPKYAELSEYEMRHSIKKKILQLTALSLAIIVSYVVAAPTIFKFLFPQYTESIIYSQIYILGLVTIPSISLFATYFQLKKATRTMYKLNIFGNTTTLVITFPLIYYYGLMGAVVANGLSWTMMLFFHLYYFILDRSK